MSEETAGKTFEALSAHLETDSDGNLTRTNVQAFFMPTEAGPPPGEEAQAAPAAAPAAEADPVEAYFGTDFWSIMQMIE